MEPRSAICPDVVDFSFYGLLFEISDFRYRCMKTYQIPEALLARCAGQMSICRKVVHKYVEQMENDLASLIDLASQSDTQGVCKLAHRMKGASSNVAAVELTQMAATIEELAAEGAIENDTPEVSNLKQAWQEYKTITEPFLAEDSSCAS